MDWSIILDYILKIVGSIGASVIVTLAGILFAKLQSKIKDSKIVAYIKEAVKAAEQLYPNQGVKMGTVKYDYVVKQVLKKFPTITDNEYLKSLIEGAVFALNNKLEENKNKTIVNNTVEIATQETKSEDKKENITNKIF